MPKEGEVRSTPLALAASYSIGDRVILPGYSEVFRQPRRGKPSDNLFRDYRGNSTRSNGVSAVEYLIMDASIATGGSGAPVLNMGGGLVGIVSFVDPEDVFAYAVSLVGRIP